MTVTRWAFRQGSVLVSAFLLVVSIGQGALGAPEVPEAAADGSPAKGVRYKAGKDVNFEELLINGQLKRPEISVVTGNAAQGTDGLLRLRENFLDRITCDFGEEIP